MFTKREGFVHTFSSLDERFHEFFVKPEVTQSMVIHEFFWILSAFTSAELCYMWTLAVLKGKCSPQFEKF